MPREATIQDIEACSLAAEIRRILSIGHGYEGTGSACPLARGPVLRGKPGYNTVKGGYRRIAYLKLH